MRGIAIIATAATVSDAYVVFQRKSETIVPFVTHSRVTFSIKHKSTEPGRNHGSYTIVVFVKEDFFFPV